ncbi:MAG: hypothetical protein ACYS47_20405, partial [Planctomycetota bacterium]
MELPDELLTELAEAEGRWLSPEEMAAFKAKEAKVLASARAEVEKRKKDPFHAHVVRILKYLAKVKGLADYQFLHRRSDPYLLFEHAGRKGRTAYRSKEAIAQLDKKVESIRLVYRFVTENLIRPLALTRDDARPLVVISFEDRAIFDEYHRSIGLDLTRSALAYFQPLTKFIVMYSGTGGQFGRERSDWILFHEATHQILDAFANPRGGMNVRLSAWFNEGMAEYIGSTRLKPKGDGTFEHLIAYEMSSSRLSQFYSARFPRKFRKRREKGVSAPYHLTLEEMVQTFVYEQANKVVLRKWVAGGGVDPRRTADPEERAGIHSVAQNMIYAQACSFMFFCFKGKPEKYKAKMMEYMKRELQGKRIIRGAKT